MPANPFKPIGPENTDPQRMAQRFQARFAELRRLLRDIPPERLAARCAAEYDAAAGCFFIPLWGRAMRVTYPDFQIYQAGEAPGGEPVPSSGLETAFLLYYFATADGAPLEERWIAFSDLPDGRFYDRAFQGYTGKELQRAFGENITAFEKAAAALDGRPYPLGDAAFTFQALPRVPLTAVFWRGDEDFPSTCQLLFDASVSRYLPTDACAVLGSTLTRRLIKQHSTE